jgi:hypothetical protein
MMEVPEVVVADQGTLIEARFHKVAFKGSFSLFSWISYVVGDCCGLDIWLHRFL